MRPLSGWSRGPRELSVLHVRLRLQEVVLRRVGPCHDPPRPPWGVRRKPGPWVEVGGGWC
ncbi:hypothetical protein GCM10009745_25140 [Kribbella yunnanensis]|uniref:Uncharacterized protein n=1 Tax=Kribbella yunnanensis TaxID=190194 RepID=A0ABP4T054_9ACTN